MLNTAGVSVIAGVPFKALCLSNNMSFITFLKKKKKKK